MKSIKESLLAIIIGLIFSFNFVNGQSKQKPVYISGVLSAEHKPARMDLFNIESGAAMPLISTDIATDGTFAINVLDLPYEGFYRLSQYYNAAVLYLKPGKKLNIHLQREGYTIKSKDKENIVLQEWNSICNLVSRNRRNVANPAPIIWAELDSIVQVKNTFIAKVKTGNKKFDAAFKKFAEAQFNFELCNLTMTPPNNKPAVSSYPKIYQEIRNGLDFVDTRILRYDFGMQYLNAFLQFGRTLEVAEGNKSISTTELCDRYIKSDTLKEILLYRQLSRALAYDDTFIRNAKQAEPYFVTNEIKERYNDLVISLKNISKGAPAIKFGGKDVNGKSFTIQDFKGKLVYVDLWATWCVPCLKEIPSLKLLEEEFHGQDIVFLSLAVSDNLDKWKKKVTDDNMTGVQLFADPESDQKIKDMYKVNGIPRFMLFDKDNKVITIDAVRPSDPKIKEILKSELEK